MCPPKQPKTNSSKGSGNGSKNNSNSQANLNGSQNQKSNEASGEKGSNQNGGDSIVENSGQNPAENASNLNQNLQNDASANDNSKISKKSGSGVVNPQNDSSLQRIVPNDPSKLKQASDVRDKPPGPKLSNVLVVTISSCEFSKDFNYFISLQLGTQGEKHRTEVSSVVHNPVFRKNTFVFPLEGRPIDFYKELFLSAFIVLNVEDYSRENADQDHAGEARLLGDASLNLIPHKPVLLDIRSNGIKQSLKFTRKTTKAEPTVGRIVVNVKYIGKQPQPELDNESGLAVSQSMADPRLDAANPNLSAIERPLPRNDGYLFHWRVRIDIRTAIDIALNRDSPLGLPSAFVELGLSSEFGQRPPDNLLQVTKTIPNERNPIWNQQFLLVRDYEESADKNLFVYIAFIDRERKDKQPLDALWMPVFKMNAFQPYNLELVTSKYEFKIRGKYFISLVLEEIEPESQLDQYADVVVHNFSHDPLPQTLNRFWIVMTLFDYSPTQITFESVDLEKVKEFDQVLQFVNQNRDKQRVFISSILKIPPMQIELFFKGVALFCLPKTLLQTNIRLFLVYRDPSRQEVLNLMPNTVGGRSEEILDTKLETLF